MSTVKSLFSRLREQNIKLVLKGENLEVISMGAKMSGELVGEIKALKPEIIAYLEEIDGGGNASGNSIPKAGEKTSYPLSSAQKRLWLLSQFREGSIAYNMPNSIELGGEVDIESFAKAVLAVMDRHEVLRTVFVSDGEGKVCQKILSTEESGFNIEDLDLSETADALTKAREIITGDAIREFDLEKGPLLRAKLIRVSDDRCLFYYNMHHIVSDGWSVKVLINDVMTCYEAFAKGEKPELAELPIQYKDYAQWQSDQINDGVFDAHRAYWTNSFAKEVTVLELPMQKPRPMIKSSVGSAMNTFLSADTTRSLKKISQEKGGSIFMGVMSTIKALLFRYTGESDIVVGTPVAGRDHSDLEPQIGFYVNMLPIRTAITRTDSMWTLTDKVISNVSQGLKFQAYPFDALVEELEIHRDGSRNPLFNFSLTFDNINDGSDEQLSENQLSEITFEEDLTVRFDVEFHVHETGDHLAVRIIYNNELYSRESIYNLLRTYINLVNAAVSNPEIQLGRLDILSGEDRQMCLREFNNTTTDYPRDKSLVALFSEQVNKTPDSVALEFKNKTFTYQELDRITNQLSRCLQENYEIGIGEFVGIQLDRSEWMIIAILAVIKTGAAYVPIEAETPVGRKEQIFKDANIQVLITEANYIFDLDYFEGNVFGIDVEFEPDEYSDEPLNKDLGPQDLAYVMFTSGSTGVPKGVLIEHRNIVRLVRNTNIHSFSEKDTVLSTGAPAFDATTIEYWGPLLNGGKLVLVSKETLLQPEKLKNEIVAKKVNFMWFTAGWLSQLVENHIDVFESLDVVMAGGDRLPVAQVSKLRLKYPELCLINGYGPTENTTFSLTYPIDEITGDIPIGYPVSNSTAFILSEEEMLQPIGVVGEIVVGGDGLARGYLNDEDLTSRKFIANPFVEGERLYKTGDLGKWDSDGRVHFIGRKDDQVKIRGYRIGLGEIERALAAVPAVDETVVVALDNEKGDKDLIAYVSGDANLNSGDIRNALKNRIPDYMIPAAYVLLDKMPLTKNGKIDRAALPKPEQGALGTGKAFVEPRNETEEKLVRIWKEVLKKEKVSVLDDFFELGGHSLKATFIQNEYYKEFGIKPGFDELFANTVLESHLALVEGAKQSDFKDIQPVEPAESYPISDGQRRLWVLSQFESAAYNMPFKTELQGAFDLALFEKAVIDTIRRHEILRTVFKQNEQGEVRQWISRKEDLSFTLDYQDFRNTENGKFKAVELVETDSFKSFDLENGPLIRSSLYQIEDDLYIFYFNMHHIISDGWSMEIIKRDILAFYSAHKTNVSPGLPELNIQYKDYAVWQLGQLQEENRADHSFWMNKLSGDLPKLNLPSEKKRPNVMTNNGHVLSMVLSEELTGTLKSFCQQEGGSLYMGLVTLWNTLLYKYSGTKDIILGTPVAGRDHTALKDQVGFYVNTLVLRNEVNPADSFIDHFRKVKKSILESYQYQWYPFDRLVENLDISRSMDRGVIFDIMITLQNAGENEPGTFVAPESVNTVSDMGDMLSKFDLDITFEEIGNNLSLDIVYNRDVYDQATMTGLMKHFLNLTELVMQEVDRSIAAYDILSDFEKRELLQIFNDTETSYQESSVLEMFEKQVSENPDLVAIRFETDDFTYAFVNENSDRIAAYLVQNLGGIDNQIIGVKLSRSAWQIVTLLGILKAGAAYLPIDPEMPEERIDFLMNDSQLVLCIDDEMLTKIQTSESSTFKRGTDNPENLAYLMYTSGSTGTPKGVKISRGALVDYVQTFNTRFAIGTADKVIHQSSLSFDVSVEEIFPALCSGATIIQTKDGARDIRELVATIQREKATVLSTVPLVISELNNHGSQLNTLRLIISGGDVLKREQFSNLTGNRTIVNSYGPTESTVCATYGNVSSMKQTITIGKPIENRQIYILDENLQLVPKGVVGEICIGGKGLATGYLGNESLTAEQFIGNPFVEGERLYRSGDLGAWTMDGEIQFFGRNDDQVKIQGVRIELGEIERTIEAHQAVQTAVVLSWGAGNEKSLVSFVEWKGEENSADLQVYLKRLLPTYMVPGTCVEMKHWPETPNGKLDKKALIKLLEQSEGASRKGLELEEATEIQLAAIWQNVLNKEQVWADSDFFALGGHSLKAVQMTHLIHETFGVRLGLQDIFKTAELRSLAQRINASALSEYKTIDRAPEQETYPVSHAQRRMWVLNQFSPEVSLSYNLASVNALGPSIDVAIFEKAFDLLINRHESLRTVFVFENDGPRQKILKREHYPFAINIADLRSKKNSEEILTRLIGEYQTTPFDLENGPLFRASLLQMDEQTVFVLNIHHIISDGISMDILSRDLVAYYESVLLGTAAQLPHLEIQFKDYAVWQNAALEGDSYQEHRSFWLNRFSGELPVLDLPISKTRPANSGAEGRRYHIQLSPQISEALNSKAKDSGVTLFSLLLTGINILLNKYTGEHDFIIGTPVSGRDHKDLQNQIGFFMNTVAIRSIFNDEMSVDEVLKEVSTAAVNSLSHHAYPFDTLVDELNLKRDVSRNPLFDIYFNLLNHNENEGEFASLLAQEPKIEDSVNKFDLDIYAREESGMIFLAVSGNRKLYSDESLVQFTNYFVKVLGLLVDQPERKLKAISLYEKDVRSTSRGAFARDESSLMFELFSKQAQHTPDQVAVNYGGQNYSYQQIEELSNRLARQITAEYSVKPGDIVGLYVDTSVYAVIGLLAILKSGGAFVNLDKDDPKKRLEGIIRDAEIKCVITDDEAIAFEGIEMCGYSDALLNYDPQPLNNASEPDAVAYVAYTSGSTGTPKGVIVQHHSFVNAIKGIVEATAYSSDWKYLLNSRLSFDPSLRQIFVPLSIGASLFIPENIRDIGEVGEFIKSNGINAMYATPPVWDVLLETGSSCLGQIQLALSSGAQLSAKTANALLDCIHPEGKLINQYGPTEVCMICTWSEVKKEDGKPGIGLPGLGYEVYLVDKAMNLVPAGIPGELLVKSENLSIGYLNGKEQTQEKFIENPFGTGKVYRTGDLAIRKSDGTLEFLGRSDDQLKFNGYRFECGEIEAVLCEVIEVTEAVVQISKEGNAEYLIAYIVPESGHQLEVNKIKQHLKEFLPSYMIPSRYVELDKIPLNRNGKVDRKQLAALEDGVLRSSEEMIQPGTDLEAEILSVWKELLGFDAFGVNSDFFELGGNSIKATRLIADYHKKFEVKLSLRDFFMNPTIRGHAELIEINKWSGGETSDPQEELETISF